MARFVDVELIKKLAPELNIDDLESVEIVKCKDCQYWNTKVTQMSMFGDKSCVCNYFDGCFTLGDSFCNMGVEKK